MAKRNLGRAAIQVVDAVRRELEPRTQGTVRVAVSGGADSLALAAGVAWWQHRIKKPRLKFEAMVVDHQLQPGSIEVARQTQTVLENLGLETTVTQVDVQVQGQGVEAAARRARYDALTGCLGGSDVVLLGHTLDDQAETVLLGLTRGSGLRSIAGMRPNTMMGPVSISRPLLGLRREQTVQACQEWGLEYWDDPTNESTDYLRNRIRLQVMPILEAELGPAIPQALARTAALATADADYLDQLAAEALEKIRIDRRINPQAIDAAIGKQETGNQETGQQKTSNPESASRKTDTYLSNGLDVDQLGKLPIGQQGRVVRTWLQELGIAATFVQTRAILDLVNNWRGQGSVNLAREFRISRINRGLWVV